MNMKSFCTTEEFLRCVNTQNNYVLVVIAQIMPREDKYVDTKYSFLYKTMLTDYPEIIWC